jgi:Xaa-Pro dipeptidase
MVVSSTANLHYFASISVQPFERFSAVIVPAEGDPVLVLPALEAEKAKEQSNIKEVKSFTDDVGPDRVVAATLRSLHLTSGNLGVESSLPYRFLKEVTAAAPRARIVDANEAVMELRLIKEADELQKMKKAGRIVNEGIEVGIASIRSGVTEAAIGFEIEKRIRELGGEKVPFNAVLAGRNAALPHGESGQTKVEVGDCVLMDVSATYQGYYADLTRTVFVGRVSTEQKSVYETVLAAQRRAVSRIRPGIRAGALDRAAREVVTKAGYGRYFIHRTGHGLGLDVHEDPSITGDCLISLKPGMTFTVEPGVYLPTKFGVRIEDDLVVTSKGFATLGSCDKNLLVV